ncbi:MAG: hypothetical protein KatS3mg113_0088 [Planctomycetaceae bacterium]|nr:MAG: hypothetical protein KatS3mg113_0088 [Planctomycetaceae bacterium]
MKLDSSTELDFNDKASRGIERVLQLLGVVAAVIVMFFLTLLALARVDSQTARSVQDQPPSPTSNDSEIVGTHPQP